MCRNQVDRLEEIMLNQLADRLVDEFGLSKTIKEVGAVTSDISPCAIVNTEEFKLACELANRILEVIE